MVQTFNKASDAPASTETTPKAVILLPSAADIKTPFKHLATYPVVIPDFSQIKTRPDDIISRLIRHQHTTG